MKMNILITKLLILILVIIGVSFASSGWCLIGLENLNITSLNPYGGILFVGCDTGLHVYDGKDKWDKYPGLRRLPVHAVENLRTYQIAISGSGTWSDAAYFGRPEINGFPFYKFYHLDWIAWPFALAIKTTQEKDTIFVGCKNNIFFSKFDTTTKTLNFVLMKTPKNCFGTENPKCAALQLFNDDQLFAGGYDRGTSNPGQGHLLWEMGDSMVILKQLNVTSIIGVSDSSPVNELYIGTLDSGIYYHNVVNSYPPRRFSLSPNNEPVIDMEYRRILSREDTLIVAVKSGVFARCVKNDDQWRELGDLPAVPNCLAYNGYETIVIDCTLYAGTPQGVYIFDPSAVPINYQLEGNIGERSISIKPIPGKKISITFSLQKPGNVYIDIFDLVGRNIASIDNRYYSVGKHVIVWDVNCSKNKTIAKGIYFLKITVLGMQSAKRFVLAR